MAENNELVEMTNEDKIANLTALNYIKSIASSSNTDISKWNILEIFGKKDGVGLVLEKKQLNKLFFDQVMNVAAVKVEEPNKKEEELKKSLEALKLEVDVKGKKRITKAKIKELEKELEEIEPPFDFAPVAAQITTAFNNSASRVLNALKTDVKAHKENMDYRFLEFTKTEKLYFENSMRLVVLEAALKTDAGQIEKSKSISTKIEALIKEEIWVNPVFDNGALYLNTKSNVVLHEVNKAANLDLHVDLGQFAVKIHFLNNYCSRFHL